MCPSGQIVKSVRPDPNSRPLAHLLSVRLHLVTHPCKQRRDGGHVSSEISRDFAQRVTQPVTLSAVGLPSSNESHPMDHDSNSSGHAKSKDLTLATRAIDDSPVRRYSSRQRKRVFKFSIRPSDLFTSGRMIVSCEPGEKTLPYVVSAVGDQCIMYASDYPHPESKWPNTVAPIQKAEMSAAAKKRILWENAARVYKLGDVMAWSNCAGDDESA